MTTMPSGTREEENTEEFKDEEAEHNQKAMIAFVCMIFCVFVGVAAGVKERYWNQTCGRPAQIEDSHVGVNPGTTPAFDSVTVQGQPARQHIGAQQPVQTM